MKNVRTRLYATVLAASLGLTAVGSLGAPAHALSNPPLPTLTLDHQISSHPWPGSGTNAGDVEGSAYVPSDQSMWITDDNRDRVYEINPTTGALKRSITATAFQTAVQVGTGVNGVPAVLADATRTDDFESAAYDQANDVLYVFSANCCGVAPFNPTAYKLVRDGSGNFQPVSFQPLDQGQDPTGAGFRPGTGLYYGHGSKIKFYDYNANTRGPDISIGVAASIVGMTFTDANTLFVSTSNYLADPSLARVIRINPANWSVVPGWTFDLRLSGVLDPRSVEIVGDTFYVLDGADDRPSGDHPVFVFNLGNAPAPTASFTAVPTTGRAPFDVNFTDTSIGNPTSWAWDFENDGTVDSTTQNATHSYTVAGTYTAKLTATNASGSTSATQKISVSAATALPGGYILDGFGGLNAFRVGTGPQPAAISGAPYWPGWDIARGVGVLSNGSGGYLLDGFGGLNRFRIGSGAQPQIAVGAPYWPGWDIARGVALLPDRTGGYIVDGFGGIHGFAIGSNPMPPTVFGLPYWQGQDMARGITITPDGKGGYVNDRFGVLHKFRIGANGAKPRTPNNVFVTTAVDMNGVALISDGTGGLTIDAFGGLHRFGVNPNAPPPAVVGAPYWPGWNIARDVALLPG